VGLVDMVDQVDSVDSVDPDSVRDRAAGSEHG